MTTDSFHSQLEKLKKNPDQFEAYSSNENCAVKAGPGSGKTATMTLKVVRLLNEQILEPQGLACLTFNNEAVREFKHRLEILKLKSRKNVFLGTVHSFCLQNILTPFAEHFIPEENIFPLKIANEEIQSKLYLKAMQQAGITDHYERLNIEIYRKERISSDPKTLPPHAQYDRVLSLYEKSLRKEGLIDFDDQIILSLQIIRKSRLVRKIIESKFPWIMIDEYQDLGNPLHQLVMSLKAATEIKFFIVGDPDQSIYRFQGASPKYIEDIYSDPEFTKIRLKLNYRCGQNIIDSAENILDPETPRNYTSARTEENKGEIHTEHCREGFEAQLDKICKTIIPNAKTSGVKPSEIAILYIDKYDMIKISKALDSYGIPYHGERDLRYPRTNITRWLEDIGKWSHGLIDAESPLRFETISKFWVKLRKDSHNVFDEKDELDSKVDFLQCLKSKNFIGTTLSAWLEHLNKVLNLEKYINQSSINENEKSSYKTLLQACKAEGHLKNFTFDNFIGYGPEQDRITVTTLHSSKGRQFDVIIIPGLEKNRLPSFRDKTETQIKEARRLFFVGVTRARFKVHLFYSGFTVNQYGKRFNDGPSPFISEVTTHLYSRFL